ncbi:MAG TPA: tetratricopeptide repeat protein [Candidatus Obscuribacter sp.]|nr:tetratricopeptide repeat protein [Candidatus Obscuribacter sp.]HMX44515.1 tetratricopeptide repeat protein [Candidatus Obscuribacter sp.]HMY02282.1 tetratricopeptide repeat protein [Candidatus Obscuribacter sp.]HMY52536.1 tetratricopeptide repeat protein [Candidatus Obscuribacter sp.]HNB13942.1 tetratricopeptide repeat protein [Candidatus Obscuribacter sp.]
MSEEKQSMPQGAADQAAAASSSATAVGDYKTPLIIRRPGNPLVGVLLSVLGLVFIGILYLIVFKQNIPYLGGSLDSYLDRTLRYKPDGAPVVADWRENLLIEQTVWIDELARMASGDSRAKPYKLKRDYLLFLADSFYRDEPKFSQAAYSYIAALVEPKVPHENAINTSDGELTRRVGYCYMRLGKFEQAETYLRRALKLAQNDLKADGKPKEPGVVNWALENLTETLIRSGKLEDAKALIDQRLKSIDLQDAIYSVEAHLVFNYALLLDKQGRLAEADKYYQRTIELFEQEDALRGVIVGSANDNNRNLARVLKDYARFLRAQKRFPEAWDKMSRALTILDNSP